MKIYFAHLVSSANDSEMERFGDIVSSLERYGEVLTKQCISSEWQRNLHGKESSCIYDELVRWFRSADVLVAEVSVESAVIGYMTGLACSRSLPVLCLYQSLRPTPSVVFSGNPAVSVRKYFHTSDVPRILERFFGTSSSKRQQRHDFHNYLIVRGHRD